MHIAFIAFMHVIEKDRERNNPHQEVVSGPSAGNCHRRPATTLTDLLTHDPMTHYHTHQRRLPSDAGLAPVYQQLGGPVRTVTAGDLAPSAALLEVVLRPPQGGGVGVMMLSAVADGTFDETRLKRSSHVSIRIVDGWPFWITPID